MSIIDKLIGVGFFRYCDREVHHAIVKFLNKQKSDYYISMGSGKDAFIADFVNTRCGWIGYIKGCDYILIVGKYGIDSYTYNPHLTRKLVKYLHSGRDDFFDVYDYSMIGDCDNSGTGQTTTSAAFNALSPMTTLGDIIYGGASGTGTRLAVGASNEVLTVSGGIPSWQPAAASPASKGIYQGHMVDSSTDYWSRGNTALGDMTTNGTPVLVQDYNSGMGTVTIASGDGPGIALTAPFTGTIEVTCVLFNQVPAGTMTVQLVEAGGTVLNGSRNLVSASMTLVGVFDVTASSSYTFKLQTAITTGTGYVGGVGTPGYSLGFSVKYIK